MAKKILKGVIVAKSGDKTYKVLVEYVRKHPLYRKIITVRRKFLAHSDKDISIGEKVYLVETRRISKNKHFIIETDINKIEKIRNA